MFYTGDVMLKRGTGLMLKEGFFCFFVFGIIMAGVRSGAPTNNYKRMSIQY